MLLIHHTHAIFTSLNPPKHSGRKGYPHVKRCEFHQVKEHALGHTAKWHHIWDPNPGLCPAEMDSQPWTTWGQAPLRLQWLLIQEKPFNKLIWCEGSDFFIIHMLLFQKGHSCVWLDQVLLYLYGMNSQLKKKKRQKVSFIWLNLQRGRFQGWTWLLEAPAERNWLLPRAD